MASSENGSAQAGSCQLALRTDSWCSSPVAHHDLKVQQLVVVLLLRPVHLILRSFQLLVPSRDGLGGEAAVDGQLAQLFAGEDLPGPLTVLVPLQIQPVPAVHHDRDGAAVRSLEAEGVLPVHLQQPVRRFGEVAAVPAARLHREGRSAGHLPPAVHEEAVHTLEAFGAVAAEAELRRCLDAVHEAGVQREVVVAVRRTPQAIGRSLAARLNHCILLTVPRVLKEKQKIVFISKYWTREAKAAEQKTTEELEGELLCPFWCRSCKESFGHKKTVEPRKPRLVPLPLSNHKENGLYSDKTSLALP